MKDDGHTRGERSDLTLTVDSRATVMSIGGGISCPQNSCEARQWGEWRGGTATASLAQLRSYAGSTATADRGQVLAVPWYGRQTTVISSTRTLASRKSNKNE